MANSGRTTKLLSVISVMMMLSMAFIGVSFLTDDEGSSADTTDNKTYTYEVLLTDVSSSVPFSFVATNFGPEMLEVSDGPIYATHTYTSETKPSTVPDDTDESVLYQLDNDDAYLDFTVSGPMTLDGGGGFSPYVVYNSGNTLEDYYTYTYNSTSRTWSYHVPITLFSTQNLTEFTLTTGFRAIPGGQAIINFVFTVHLLTHTVTFNANGGSPTPSTQTVYQGCTATQPTAPTKANNTFDGWYTDSTLTTAYDFSNAVTFNRTLYAKWTPIVWTVTYDLDGGTLSKTSDTVTQGASLTLPTPTKTGYNFKGWYDPNNNLIGTGGTSYTPSADITLKASWEQVLSISSTPSQTSVVKGNTWTYTPTVNATGYTLSLSSTAPSWLSVNGSSIQGTPGSSVTTGTYTFTMFCQKTGCQTAEQSITLTVVSALTISNPTLYILAYEG